MWRWTLLNVDDWEEINAKVESLDVAKRVRFSINLLRGNIYVLEVTLPNDTFGFPRCLCA
jgi:hypothetical protein